MDIFSTVAPLIKLESPSFSKNLFKRRTDLGWSRSQNLTLPELHVYDIPENAVQIFQ